MAAPIHAQSTKRRLTFGTFTDRASAWQPTDSLVVFETQRTVASFVVLRRLTKSPSRRWSPSAAGGTIADLPILYWIGNRERTLNIPSRTAGIASQLLIVLAVVFGVFAALSAVVVAAVA